MGRIFQYECRASLAECSLTTKNIESQVRGLSGGEQAKLMNREINVLFLIIWMWTPKKLSLRPLKPTRAAFLIYQKTPGLYVPRSFFLMPTSYFIFPKHLIFAIFYAQRQLNSHFPIYLLIMFHVYKKFFRCLRYCSRISFSTSFGPAPSSGYRQICFG